MVACKDNEIIAVSVCRFRSTIQSYELECAVKTEFRRHKIASNLLKNHIEICKSNGHTYFLANVHPDNTSSIKLVENLGFTLNHELSFGIHKSYQLHLDSSTHRAE
jgi:ribosomal protein S18 acetylase RimI-like enzyme